MPVFVRLDISFSIPIRDAPMSLVALSTKNTQDTQVHVIFFLLVIITSPLHDILVVQESISSDTTMCQRDTTCPLGACDCYDIVREQNCLFPANSPFLICPVDICNHIFSVGKTKVPSDKSLSYFSMLSLCGPCSLAQGLSIYLVRTILCAKNLIDLLYQ